MNCPDCTAATKNPHWGGYHAACQGCQVRALATGRDFWESDVAGARTKAYRAALESVFGAEWVAGHDQVKAEHDRIKQLGTGPEGEAK